MAGITAVYVDADSFTVATDRTSEFSVGRRVRAYCGTDGYKYGTVESSSYSDPNTTVNLKSANDDLTTNLTEVQYGEQSQGTTGSVPEHSHDGAEGSGGSVSDSSFYADSTETDQGATGNGRSIKALVDSIGSNTGTIKLRHDSGSAETTYTVTTNETIPDNITLDIESGAIIDGAGTLTYNGPPISNPYQHIYGTTITLAFGVGSIDIITPEMFGAKGDNSTNDVAAINSMFDCVRLNDLKKVSLKAMGEYRVNSSIDMTDLRDWGLVVEGNGALISGHTSGAAVLDMLDSQAVTTRNLLVYGGDTNKPSYGIQHGRGIIGQDATQMNFENVHLTGYYTEAGIYNLGSEITTYDNVKSWNSEVGGFCLYLDARNEAHISSAHFTVTTVQDSALSFNDNVFTNCSFEQLGASGGAAVRIAGPTNNHRFVGCYAQAQTSHAVEIAYNQFNLYLDIHCEPTTVTENVIFESSNGAMQLNGFTLRDYYVFCTASVMDCDDATAVSLINSVIDIGNADDDIPIMGTTGTVNFHGTLYLNEATSDGLYDLSNFNTLFGTVYSQKAKSVFTMPTAGYFKLHSQADVVTYQVGHERNHEGASIASAAELVLGTGEAFYVTGTTNVTSIRAADTYAGRNIILVFGGILTLTNGNNIVIGSNFVTNANSLIELYCMGGTNWLQRSRNQN